MMAVGFVGERVETLPIARVCGWCHTAMSERDRNLMERGARVSHTICKPCERKHFPDLSESKS